MAVKIEKKNWLFAGFITGLCVLMLWVIVFFVDYNTYSNYKKVIFWMQLVAYTPILFIFYNAYKKELRKTKIRLK